MSDLSSPASSPVRLAVGETRMIELHPRLLYIPTDVSVLGGERYWLRAQGHWKDWFRLCDASGWNPPAPAWVRALNRVKGENTFVLCASIGRTTLTARSVGLSAEIAIVAEDLERAKAPHAALYVFANDWAGMYWNNRIASTAEGGPMKLVIERMV